jgi:hypothetical protein
MKTHFSTAAEYLAHLQELYTRRYSSGTPVDAEFQRLTEESLSARGIELPHHPVSGIGSVVENIWRDILNALEKSVRDVTKPCIAAGVVENGKANAFIVKSPDGKYAIIFNSGLGIFLHKLFKITSGCVEPQSVTYCNRKSANLLTRGDMRAYLDEYINYYRENGVPRGPLIKLTQKASATAALQLNASELFILCHELGHFLNGDLDNECLYSALPKGMPGSVYQENKNHGIEYEADSTGFGIYRKVLSRTVGEIRDELYVILLIGMFDAIYLISEGATHSHPHPYDRIIRLAQVHFNSELAGRIKEALINPDLFPAFYKSLGLDYQAR